MAAITQTPAPTPHRGPCVDHLIVLAADLASGVQWCERTLGVTPPAGGEHPLMCTHNRILGISSVAHPRAYLEVIAINPGATSALPASARRWFDMDDSTLQQQVATHGPMLIHWVASVPDLAQRCDVLAAQGIERGPVTAASRPTPQGLLRWQITVREDGLRLMDGCLPTLIEWSGAHPCDSLPASGVELLSLSLQHPQAATLQSACDAIGVSGQVGVSAGHAPQITARLSTPQGHVTLSSLRPS